MKLIEVYSRSAGLEIGKQWSPEAFFSLTNPKYITLHASSGMPAKNYPYYNEVVRLLSNILNSQGISVVQMGGKDDPAIPGCVHIQGQTSLHQAHFVLSKSLLHLGNDSWMAHRAGAAGIPLITLFGSTSASNHSAYLHDPNKTSFIESHRWGKRPTFASHENPQTIALIDPYHVANEVLRLLGIKDVFTQESRFWGLLYQHTIIDIIPNMCPGPDFLPGSVFNVRMDYEHNEEVLAQILSTGRKVNIITKSTINPQIIIGYKTSILSYNHELGAENTLLPTIEYVASVKSAIKQSVFFTRERDSKKLSDIRLIYFPDICTVEQIKDTEKNDYLSAALNYLNKEDTPENRIDLEGELKHTRFRANKYLLSDGNCYLSLAHKKEGKTNNNLTENTGDIIDSADLWRDLNHFHIWYERSNSNAITTS